MQVWIGPLVESELRHAQAQIQAHRAMLEMPPESEAAFMFSLEPVGTRVPNYPDGKTTSMVLVDEGPVPIAWTVPTSVLKGGKGLKFELFGRLVEPGTEGPTWTVALKSERPTIVFQPWLIRAYKPGSPLVARILWTPQLNRDHKSLDWIADDWDGKAYDQWQRSAGLAMKFLHDFTRNVAGGRPKGSVKGKAWSRREILAWYEESASEFASDGKPVGLKDLGAAMGVSDETAGKRVRETRLSWPPTPEQLEELYANE